MSSPPATRIPRLNAGASLKRIEDRKGLVHAILYSPAECRGLIEASGPLTWAEVVAGIPRLNAGASLKLSATILFLEGICCSIPRLNAGASLKHRRDDRTDQGEGWVFPG